LNYEAHIQGHWIGWNLFLAALPGFGAMALYKWRHHRGGIWWAGIVVEALLLPNAPYVLTDIIHLPSAVHSAPSKAAVIGGVLPLFLLLIGGGVASYVLALRLLRSELRRRGWGWHGRIAAEIVVDVACAIGVALGRVPRLNSWDVIHPAAVLHGFAVLAGDPRSVGLALVAILVASVTLDRAADSALHLLRARRHRTDT
jgi:uncharacterized membrane protein